MSMHWPQITWIVLVFISLGIHAVQHGKPMGNYNFMAKLVTLGFGAWLLWAGGFFG